MQLAAHEGDKYSRGRPSDGVGRRLGCSGVAAAKTVKTIQTKPTSYPKGTEIIRHSRIVGTERRPRSAPARLLEGEDHDYLCGDVELTRRDGTVFGRPGHGRGGQRRAHRAGSARHHRKGSRGLRPQVALQDRSGVGAPFLKMRRPDGGGSGRTGGPLGLYRLHGLRQTATPLQPASPSDAVISASSAILVPLVGR